jgi:hypothetical protein
MVREIRCCRSRGVLLPATVLALGLVVVQAPQATAQPKPISVTGWIADVILDVDMNARYAITMDNGSCCFFEAGAIDNTGVERDDGLPAGGTVTSMTGSGAVYQIQPANGNNALQVYHRRTATLTLVTPAPYSSLFVIAASGNGDQFGVQFPGVVHYDDGSTQSFSYNCFDWDDTGNPHPEEAISLLGRACSIGDAGNVLGYDGSQRGHFFSLFETSIATDNTKNIMSVDFSGFPSARGGHISNIFAISGQ